MLGGRQLRAFHSLGAERSRTEPGEVNPRRGEKHQGLECFSTHNTLLPIAMIL